MKKIFALILCTLLCFCAGCGTGVTTVQVAPTVTDFATLMATEVSTPTPTSTVSPLPPTATPAGPTPIPAMTSENYLKLTWEGTVKSLDASKIQSMILGGKVLTKAQDIKKVVSLLKQMQVEQVDNSRIDGDLLMVAFQNGKPIYLGCFFEDTIGLNGDPYLLITNYSSLKKDWEALTTQPEEKEPVDLIKDWQDSVAEVDPSRADALIINGGGFGDLVITDKSMMEAYIQYVRSLNVSVCPIKRLEGGGGCCSNFFYQDGTLISLGGIFSDRIFVDSNDWMLHIEETANSKAAMTLFNKKLHALREQGHHTCLLEEGKQYKIYVNAQIPESYDLYLYNTAGSIVAKYLTCACKPELSYYDGDIIQIEISNDVECFFVYMKDGRMSTKMPITGVELYKERITYYDEEKQTIVVRNIFDDQYYHEFPIKAYEVYSVKFSTDGKSIQYKYCMDSNRSNIEAELQLP